MARQQHRIPVARAPRSPNRCRRTAFPAEVDLLRRLVELQIASASERPDSRDERMSTPWSAIAVRPSSAKPSCRDGLLRGHFE
jgi:hypothetical protein